MSEEVDDAALANCEACPQYMHCKTTIRFKCLARTLLEERRAPLAVTDEMLWRAVHAYHVAYEYPSTTAMRAALEAAIGVKS